MSQTATDAVDWVVVGISGLLFASGVLGSAFVIAYSSPSKRPAAKEFSYLWTSRLLSQVLVVLLALAQLLRLQVLWGPQSFVIPGGFHPTLLCRIFTALMFGLLEPAFLLLALFSCMYSVQGQNFSSHPNSNIIFFAVGFSLPTCAVQLVCALFTRILSVDYGDWLYHAFFSTYDTRQTEYCISFPDLPPRPPSSSTSPPSPETSIPSNCAFCTFPLFSTLISAFFSLCFLLVAWHVTQRIASTVISKVLVARIRLLQLLIAVLLPLGLACRGLTVVFEPYDLGFELLRLGHVVCSACIVMAISFILVLKPVYDSHVTDSLLLLYHGKHDQWLGIAAVDAGSREPAAPQQLVLQPRQASLQRCSAGQHRLQLQGSGRSDRGDVQGEDKATLGGGASGGGGGGCCSRQPSSSGSQQLPEHAPLVQRR